VFWALAKAKQIRIAGRIRERVKSAGGSTRKRTIESFKSLPESLSSRVQITPNNFKILHAPRTQNTMPYRGVARIARHNEAPPFHTH